MGVRNAECFECGVENAECGMEAMRVEQEGTEERERRRRGGEGQGVGGRT
jgi:hypothetical protein